MVSRLTALVCFGAIFGVGLGQDCNVADIDKYDCGYSGMPPSECTGKGCCWQPVSTRDVPWCHYPADYKSPCDNITWAATDPGFTDVDFQVMYELYRANLNVEGCGAVVAAPDQETPGGSYYYHWMRDAGLSIKAWLEINNNDYGSVQPEVDPYVDWVGIVQQKPDPNCDVRVEPKFYIPTGDPYDEGWCRPQTDGPALRAMALSKYGMILNGQGLDTSRIWDLVQFDLAWVLENWGSEGCDLWEEVRSDDFYFNRMAYVYSLNVAADFADTIGQDGSQYRTLAETIKPTAAAHYQDGFIYESTNRPIDGAVAHSIATFGEYLYPPESPESADTLKYLAKAFCLEYPINQDEIQSGVPGILIGRYPGDSYGGGNPWQLLTAVYAEVYYLGGTANLKAIQEKGEDPILDPTADKAWMDLLRIPNGARLSDLATRQLEAGDAVMYRLWTHLQGTNNRVDEQIDKFTGVQTSAEGLTWSYANILHSLTVRKSAFALKETVLGK